jgi:glycosyltransferase involved in cell wall biosynthesis
LTIHVLHILGPLRPSGMEKMLVTAASYFTQEKIKSTVLGQGSDHPFASELLDAGFDVRTIPYSVGSKSGRLELKRLVAALEVDVIHIHTEGDYLRTAYASWRAMGQTRAVVRTIHNVFQATGTWRIRRMIQAQIADRLVHVLTGPSPEVSANEKRLFRKVRVIYNWVDDLFYKIRDNRRCLQGLHNKDTVAVIVGNCSSIKHHELALHALAETNHKVIHLGNESDASEEELRLLTCLEQDGRLIRRGVEQPQESLLTGSYFMMPSRHEGMGVALAEALVAGLPCLVNDAPGLRWARFMDGVEMIPDTQEGWASAVSSMSVASLGEANTSIDFSASRGGYEYAAVYRETVAQRASRRINSSKEKSRVEMD